MSGNNNLTSLSHKLVIARTVEDGAEPCLLPEAGLAQLMFIVSLVQPQLLTT